MSRSRHPRKKAKLYSAHLRKDKTWKRDSGWKKKERSAIKTRPRKERRSPRTRYKK